jgi:Tol biopolymer transport system component
MDADGSNIVRLTENEGIADTDPAWSPDGTRIAFFSTRSDPGQIFVMDADGSNVIPLAHTGEYCDEPAWSPDGARIAFVISAGERPSYQREIFVMDADGRNVTRLTADDNVWSYHPAWVP